MWREAMKTNLLRVLFIVAAVASCASAQKIVSDDFNAYNLNKNIWQIVDPLGDVTFSLVGTGTTSASLSIAIPGSVDHQLYPPGMTAPRLMQAAPDSDFRVEVKFDTPLLLRYQIEGIIVEAADSNAIRFDLSCAGDSVMMFAMTTHDNFLTGTPQPNVNYKLFPKGTAPVVLIVRRTGDTWFVTDSIPGIGKTQRGAFTFPIDVRRVGVYAGNSGSPAPAFTAIVDYFFNAATPIIPDDGVGVPPDTLGPNVFGVKVINGTQNVQISWKTDEPSRGVVEYGTTKSYGSHVTDTVLAMSHTLTLPGADPKLSYYVRVTTDDGHPANTTIIDTIRTRNVTGVESLTPLAFALSQNYPNPFNPRTVIGYQVSTLADVMLVVYDLLGRQVAQLVNERKSPGAYEVSFDASGLASGLYVYRLTSNGNAAVRKMLLVR
jgi:hypothetical protein